MHKDGNIFNYSRYLTTQEAADILNVSRPYLISLLNQDEMPYTKIGAHRCITFDDVMAYKARRDVSRKEGIAQLMELGQEFDVQ